MGEILATFRKAARASVPGFVILVCLALACFFAQLLQGVEKADADTAGQIALSQIQCLGLLAGLSLSAAFTFAGLYFYFGWYRSSYFSQNMKEFADYHLNQAAQHARKQGMSVDHYRSMWKGFKPQAFEAWALRHMQQEKVERHAELVGMRRKEYVRTWRRLLRAFHV